MVISTVKDVAVILGSIVAVLTLVTTILYYNRGTIWSYVERLFGRNIPVDGAANSTLPDGNGLSDLEMGLVANIDGDGVVDSGNGHTMNVSHAPPPANNNLPELAQLGTSVQATQDVREPDEQLRTRPLSIIITNVQNLIVKMRD